MSSEGFFVETGDGDRIFVIGVTPEEFASKAGDGNLKLVDSVTGAEFEPQAGLFGAAGKLATTLIKKPAVAIGAAAKAAGTKMYRYIYKYSGSTKSATKIAEDVASAKKLANLPVNIEKSGSISKSTILGSDDAFRLQKSKEIEDAVNKVRIETDVSRIGKAAEPSEIITAKVKIAELDNVLTNPTTSKVLTPVEKNQFLVTKTELEAAVKNMDNPNLLLTEDGLKIAKERLVMKTDDAAKQFEDVGKTRLENWSVLEKDLLTSEERSAMRLAEERIAVEDTAKILEKESLAKVESKGIFGKISQNKTLYAGLATAAIVGTAATIGIVTAGGLGTKSGEDNSKIENLRSEVCGVVGDWKESFGDKASQAFESCRSCIVTGDETDTEIKSCLTNKLKSMVPGKEEEINLPTPKTGEVTPLYMLCEDSKFTDEQKGICKGCLESSGIGSDVTTDNTEAVNVLQTCYADKTGVPVEPAPESEATPEMLCSDMTGTDKTKCLECVKSTDTSKWSVSDSERSKVLEAVQTCFNKAGGGAADGDICEEADLSEENLAFCKACQKEVSNPQDAEAVGACLQGKIGGGVPVSGDICDDTGLDAKTRALCKACQAEVSDPQSVKLVSECISTKSMESGSPCESSKEYLTDEEYLACTLCFKPGMATEVLQDCMIDKISETTGTVPVCDVNSNSFNLSTCIGKICDPSDNLYDKAACDYYTGVVETPYYGKGVEYVDTMDPCDASSSLFDATACTDAGGEVYESAITEESTPSIAVPLAVLGGAAMLMFAGFGGMDKLKSAINKTSAPAKKTK